MLYPVAYGHVMPTAEEQQMMQEAQQRIRIKEQQSQRDPGDYETEASFSWSGLMIAITILSVLCAPVLLLIYFLLS